MKQYYVDYKVTVWRRIEVPEEISLEQLKEIVKKDSYPWDVKEFFDDEHIFFEENEMSDTEEFISPQENDNQPTIEIVEYEGRGDKTIWDNVNGDVKDEF